MPRTATPRRRAQPFASCQRGDTINPTPNTSGKFVGISPAGTLWVAFPEHDFNAMSAAFDKAFAGRRR